MDNSVAGLMSTPVYSQTQLYVDAIIGIGVVNAKAGQTLVAEGLAVRKVSKHSPAETWEWNMGVLGEMDVSDLRNLYAVMSMYRAKQELSSFNHL